MKKIRAAAVIAIATTAVSQAKEYAREHPDQASETLDKVEGFIRGKAQPKHQPYIDKGSAALRQGLGLPKRAAASTVVDTTEDPDPDTDEPWHPRTPEETISPNPAPGTSDDPQPRRSADDAAPMTPGEHLAG